MTNSPQNQVAKITDMPVATTPQKRELSPTEMVRHDLERLKGQFGMVLPKHITPERLVRIAMTAIQQTPKLLNCNKQSLYAAIMRAAQLGLEPDGVLGQAYLIPFGQDVQFIPGYKGLIDLARRSGEVSNIIAKEVCENDEFTVDFSQEIPFTHKPLLSGDRGEVTHFWALARFKDGGFHWDYMTKEEVVKIRDNSAGWKSAVQYKKTGSSPWHNHFIEMGKKTAIRRIAKYLPMSVQKAAIVEDLVDAGKKFSYNEFDDIVIDPGAIGDDSEGGEEQKKIGNEGVKDKLRKTAKQQKAEDAGADPETGELPGNSEQLPPSKGEAKWESAEDETQDRAPLPPETKAPKSTFSPGLIGFTFVGDQAEYGVWAEKFITNCKAAPNQGALDLLRKNNEKLLLQIQQRAIPAYERAMEALNDKHNEFDATE